MVVCQAPSSGQSMAKPLSFFFFFFSFSSIFFFFFPRPIPSLPSPLSFSFLAPASVLNEIPARSFKFLASCLVGEMTRVSNLPT